MPQGAARTMRQVLIVVALAAVVAWFLSVAAARNGLFDLKVYYGALHYWAREGGEIYDYLKPGSRYGYTYPPFAALLMLPMAYLSWSLAMVVSVALTVVTSAVVIWWLVDPISRRVGWTRWFTLAITFCLAAAYEPMRETVNFGQVNTLLLSLVAADVLWGVGRGRRWAGMGIGLATAIKLTPGIFLIYLLVTGRWRAAGTAVGSAVGATVIAAILAPDASREFWTQALWNTGRVGDLGFISNQSLRGMVARLDAQVPSELLWLALVLVALVIWVRRVRVAASGGDEATGLALTGVVMCLVSPVTWVHHLVWLIPALILLVDNAYAAEAGSRRRRALLVFAAVAYLILTSRFVWRWQDDGEGLEVLLGGSLYVWVAAVLLVALPLRPPTAVIAQVGETP